MRLWNAPFRATEETMQRLRWVVLFIVIELVFTCKTGGVSLSCSTPYLLKCLLHLKATRGACVIALLKPKPTPPAVTVFFLLTMLYNHRASASSAFVHRCARLTLKPLVMKITKIGWSHPLSSQLRFVLATALHFHYMLADTAHRHKRRCALTNTHLPALYNQC